MSEEQFKDLFDGHCKGCLVKQGFHRTVLVVDDAMDKYGSCLQCTALKTRSDTGYMRSYIMSRATDTGQTYVGMISFRFGFMAKILISIFSNGNVAVGVDRLGFFVFKDKESLKYPHYVAEKLTIDEQRAEGVCELCEYLFKALEAKTDID